MIDFAKLNDPAFKAQVQEKQRQKAQEQAENDRRTQVALDFCLQEQNISDKEREFLQSVKMSLSSGRQLSPKQEKWLFDIHARVFPKTYISVSSGLRGYFAVLIDTDEDGCQMPFESGIGSYKKAEEAEQEGKSWAQAEGLRFITMN